MQLSIVTLNTWKCDGEYPKRIDLILKDIQEREFDFFLGQEIFDSEDLSTWKMVTEGLNLPSVYEKSRLKNREVNGRVVPSHSGLCCWSRYTPVSTHKVELPDTPLDGERISQIITYQIGDFLLAVVNTHLTHLKDSSSLRIEQISKTLEELQRIREPDGIIFCGDFNAGKESEEIQFLIDECDFTDAYPQCFTTHTNGICLDHILYYPADRFSVNSTSVILDYPINGTIPSDHFGLHVELEIHSDE